MKTSSEEAIERCAGLPMTVFSNLYLWPHKPIILQDALNQWKAIGKWTPSYFESQFSSHPLVVDGQAITMGELICRVLASDEKMPGPYLRNYPVRDVSEGLIADILPLPEYLIPNWLETRFYPAKLNRILGRATIADLFIGGSGATFPFLHYDLLNSHAFLCQIYGTKMYTLYSPDQTPWLYRDKQRPNRSLINNIDQPDRETFPLFARANGLRFSLTAGEMLFIPAGWWHSAALLGPSITVSLNVANGSNWSGLVKDQCRIALRSAKILNRIAAVPLGFYLTLVALYRCLAPLRRRAGRT